MQLLQAPPNFASPLSRTTLNEGAVSPKKPSPVSSCTQFAANRYQDRFLQCSTQLHLGNSNLIYTKAANVEASTSTPSIRTAEKDVLTALSQIIDLYIDDAMKEVSFRLELTTPACPIKDMFEQKANEVVAAFPWVEKVDVKMSAQPAKPVFAGELPKGLKIISNIIAVSSCKV